MVSRIWSQIISGRPGGLPWSRVTGPVTATIATLWRIGVRPSNPAAWLHESS